MAHRVNAERNNVYRSNAMMSRTALGVSSTMPQSPYK